MKKGDEGMKGVEEGGIKEGDKEGYHHHFVCGRGEHNGLTSTTHSSPMRYH